MKNLTANQQQIIDDLTAEFSRINSSAKKTSGFNLIDVEPLRQKSREIEENRFIAEQDKKMWDRMAMDEAQRIAELLQQDLPFACVERYGDSNGHYDLPCVCIQREKGTAGHHERFVALEVVVIKETKLQTHDCDYKKGIALAYKHSYSGDETKYSSIEELFEKSAIKEQIRERIINYKR